MSDKIKKIGMIGVDTGRIIVADPDYIDEPRQFPHYGKLPLSKNSDKRMFAQLKNKKGIKTAIISQSGLGDGEYPVYAVIGTVGGDKRYGQRVKKVIINFDTTASRRLGKALLRRMGA